MVAPFGLWAPLLAYLYKMCYNVHSKPCILSILCTKSTNNMCTETRTTFIAYIIMTYVSFMYYDKSGPCFLSIYYSYFWYEICIICMIYCAHNRAFL